MVIEPYTLRTVKHVFSSYFGLTTKGTHLVYASPTSHESDAMLIPRTVT